MLVLRISWKICIGWSVGFGNCIVNSELVPSARERAATRNPVEALRYE